MTAAGTAADPAAGPAKPPPRILHVITGLEHGGAERQLVALLRHLPWPCEVVTLTGPGALGAELAARGVPVHQVPMRSNHDLRALPRLVRLMRRGRYDVVHTHLYRACVFGRTAAWLAGVPRVVATEHSLGDGQLEGRPTGAGVRALYRVTERFGSATVAVSPTVHGRLRAWGVPERRLTVIPNGIDPAAFAHRPDRRAALRRRLGIGETEFVVGAVGRLVATKRFDLLIEAFAATPSGRLLLAGDGPLRRPLEEQARRLGVASRVTFLGRTGDVAGVLAAMDLFAAPSDQETFGLGVLEALAAGLPVLYTACPALEDLPAAEAPDATRLPGRLADWQAALAGHCAGPPARRDVPAAVARYDIAGHVDRLMRLYRYGLDQHGLDDTPDRERTGGLPTRGMR